MNQDSRAFDLLAPPGPGDAFIKPGAVPRFGGRIESDFRAWFYTSQMPRAQISLGLAQLLVFVTLGLDLVQRPDAAGRIAVLVKLALICPLLLATMWIARSPRWRRLFPRFMCASIIAVGAAFSVMNLGEIGYGVRYDVLVLVTVFTYFLGGLAPVFASATGLCLLGLHVFLSISRGTPFEEMTYQSLLLLAINAFGMINANQTERSVRQAFWHYRSMTQMSELDELTRLLNRRGFDRQYAELWQRAQHEDQALAVAFIDVDHFKSINDRYGHAAGDEALRQVAHVLGQGTEPQPTLCARMGGDEFVAVWYGLSRSEAEMLAASLPQNIEALKFRGEPGGPALLSISVGLAICEADPHMLAAEGLRRADRVLYEAKRGGRNRVVLA